MVNHSVSFLLSASIYIVLTSWYRQHPHLCAKTWGVLLWRHGIHDFSSEIGLTLHKTCSFSTILQWNLIFSPLTWLGAQIFKFYLPVRKRNFLWVVFKKVWMIICFAVVNEMVQKLSFCVNFYIDVLANIYLLHIFIDLKTVFIWWNIIPKLKSFIQIGTFIFHEKVLTPRFAVNFLDETRYFTS